MIRDHQGPEHEKEEKLATREPQPRERVAADGREEDVRDSDRAGDDRAVQRVAPELVLVEDLVVAERRPVVRQEREARNGLRDRPERGGEAPEEGNREQHRDPEHDRVHDERPDAICPLPSGNPRRCRRRASGRLPHGRELLRGRDRRNRWHPLGHQETSAFPNSSRWTTVTTKMKTNSTRPTAAA